MYIEIKQNIVASLGYKVWRNGLECCFIAHKMIITTRTREKRDWMVEPVSIFINLLHTPQIAFNPKTCIRGHVKYIDMMKLRK